MKRFLFTLALLTTLGMILFGVQAQITPSCGCLPAYPDRSLLVQGVDQAVTIVPPMPPIPIPPPITPPPISRQQVTLKLHRVTLTVENQIATTRIEQEFLNEGARVAEGEYLFPIPFGAAVENLTLLLNGQAISAKILDAKEAEQIYNQTVRQLRDPVLLQYVGRGAIQAKVFPIPPGESRTIQITYSHLLAPQNGGFHLQYPLKTDYLGNLTAQTLSVSANVTSRDPLTNIYSPNSRVSIVREGDERRFKAGFEATNFRATEDFELFFAVAREEISANLLTYRASADEDGYFMLMLNPPLKADANRIIPKDVILVLDQSGSMEGVKWTQAQEAAKFVLGRLNPADRFNVLVFSSGVRLYAKSLQPMSEATGAITWTKGLQAEGGTNIDGALTKALEQVDPQRNTTLLFLTDGLPTEGETTINTILNNFKGRVGERSKLRMFVFGVGDDVDTVLLDTLSTEYRGQSVYVRPREQIDTKVGELYAKITAPVLTNIKLDFGDLTAEEFFPAEPFPDLFAGSQLIITGRYRKSGTITVTLTGEQDQQRRTYSYPELAFPANAGGQAFVARLWATRKIGYLTTTIRIKGSTPELVDTIVKLGKRFGIITPYTSFLIQEGDLPGRNDQAADTQTGGLQGFITSAPTMRVMATPAAAAPPKSAVQSAAESADASGAVAPPAPVAPQTRIIGSRTFNQQGQVWVDSQHDPKTQTPVVVTFLSDEYFALLSKSPELKDVFALGDRLIVVIEGKAYEVKP